MGGRPTHQFKIDGSVIFEFIPRRDGDPSTSQAGLSVGSALLETVTNDLFVDSKGNPLQIATEPGPNYTPRDCVRVQCFYPGEERPPAPVRLLFPASLRGFRLRDPADLGRLCAERVRARAHPEYFDEARRVYTGGQSFVPEHALARHIGDHIHTAMPKDSREIAARMGQLGSIVAWGVCQDISVEVPQGHNPNRSAHANTGD